MSGHRTNLRLHDLRPTGAERTPEHAEREILRHAIRLFGRCGYGGTSMRRIAAEAGVTAPLIGYHFGSKEGLFETCVEVVAGSSVEMLHVDPGSAPTLRDVVRNFAGGHVEFGRNHPESLRFILTVAYGPEENQPVVDLMRFWRPVLFELHARFEAGVACGDFVPRSGATPARLVRHLFNLVHMEIMSAYEEERFLAHDAELVALFQDETPDLVEDLVRQFFHGAGELRQPASEEKPS